MPDDHGSNLLVVLVLLLPFLRVFDAKSSAKHFSNSLQRHSLAFGIKEHNKQPTEEANSHVEPEGTTRCPVFHHRKEGRGDDNVGTPAGNRVL